jgi:hypothetical protein
MGMATMGSSSKRMCQCPCQPDGKKLKNLINCFATWQKDVATDSNSYTENCNESDIIHCRIPAAQDLFCKFDGTNNLVESTDIPQCFYNCGMQTCNAFLIAHTPNEIDCIANVFND